MILRALALGVIAVLLPGCAHNGDWMLRQPPQESTIGTDFKKAPAGKTIGPAGMGVDLTNRLGDSPGPGGIDGSRRSV
jgi:hypothetical protein